MEGADREPRRAKSPWRPKWTDAFSLAGLFGYLSQVYDKNTTGRPSDQWIVFGGIFLAIAAQSPRVAQLAREWARRKLE